MQVTSVRRSDTSPRQHGLDLVRAAAILCVMSFHARNMGLLAARSPWIISFGWMGVDLFFVLSGFLIGSQLLRPFALGVKPAYGQFFARRALRTLPAFLLVFGLYVLFPSLRETPAMPPWWQFPTFTENLLFNASSSTAFDHVWSLCVEEQFYLVFPLLVAAVALKPSAGKVAWILCASVAAGIVLRSFLWLRYVAKPTSAGLGDWHAYVSLIYYPTWSRLDGLVAGVSLALLKTFRPHLWRRLVRRPNLLVAFGLGGVVTAVVIFGGAFGPLISVAMGFPILSLSVALLVAAATTGRAIIGKYRVPGAQWIATGAYSLYLSHKIAYHVTEKWIAPFLGTTGFPRLMLALSLAVTFGAALYLLIERPFLQLRSRLAARKDTSLREYHATKQALHVTRPAHALPSWAFSRPSAARLIRLPTAQLRD